MAPSSREIYSRDCLIAFSRSYLGLSVGAVREPPLLKLTVEENAFKKYGGEPAFELTLTLPTF